MTFNEFKTIIEEQFPEVTHLQMEQFRKMEGLYREWNAKINVVSRKDIDELYRHHVLHSLAIAAYVKSVNSFKVINKPLDSLCFLRFERIISMRVCDICKTDVNMGDSFQFGF